MSTQDIYAWIQIILLVIIGGGLAWYIRLLKQAVDAQKVTIEAQSTVLQDFERLNKTMKLVLDTVADPAALQREQAYKAWVDRDADALVKEQAKQITEKSTQDVALVRQEHNEVVGQLARLIGYIMPFAPPDWRMTGLDAVELDPAIKSSLQALMRDAPYTYVAVRTGGAAYSSLSMGGGRVLISEPIPPPNEPQEGTPSPS